MSNQQQASQVNWGKIIAGAAVVAGVMLVAPNLIPDLVKTTITAASNAGATVNAAVKGIVEKGAEKAAPTAIENAGTWLLAKMAGLGLIGVATVKLLSSDGTGRQQQDRALAAQTREGFVMKEEMREAQSKMLINAAAVGNPEAQAVMAQMQGRS